MSEKIGLSDSISIGIGAMIGGGIFSVLGLAVILSGAYAPYSFLLGGGIAFLVGYSYIKLSNAYPSEGGSFTYIAESFNPRVGGYIGWLLCIGYISTLALYAYAFGSYTAALLGLEDLGKMGLQTAVILIFMVINILGVKEVGKIEKIIVGIKIALLGFFIIVGLLVPKTSTVIFESGELTNLVTATALIFVAFEGFQLIPQGIKEMKNPKKDISYAITISILIVMIVYVLISYVVMQNLNIEQIQIHNEYVLAEAAKPFLGSIGFFLVSIAALFSTTSAINATIFGTSRLTFIMATKKELPRFFSFRDKQKNTPLMAIIGVSILAIILVNLGSLLGIAAVSSAIFIVVFLFISLATFHKRKAVKSIIIIPLLGVILCTILFISLIIYLVQTNYLEFIFVIVVFCGTFVLENLFKKTEIAREEITDAIIDVGERPIYKKLQEHELNLRKKLLEQISNCQNYLKNYIKKESSKQLNKKIKQCIDNFDGFSKEIEYVLSGKKYPFLSKFSSTIFHSIIKHDKKIVDKLKEIEKNCENILSLNIEDVKKLKIQIRKLNSEITNCRNNFKNRYDYLKKIPKDRSKFDDINE